MAKWIATHKFSTLIVWILLAAAIAFWSHSLNASLNDDYSLPGTESQQAADDLVTYFPQAAGPSATVLFVSSDGSITQSQDKQYVGSVLKQLSTLDGVVAVSNPYQATNGVTPNISPDGTTALTNVNYSADTEATTELTDAMSSMIDSTESEAAALDIQVTPGGDTYFVTAGGDASDDSAEIIGLIAAVIILVVAFGSVVAMGLPLFTALVGVGVGTALTYALANWFEISSIGPIVATMIGLGVGIDYALFIVNRYREYLQEKLSVTEAIGRAIGTAGQAVIVAGLTVIIALLGLQLIGIPIMTSIAYAAAVTVAVAIFTAVTLLPALLAIFGKKIEKLNFHHLFGRTGFSNKTAGRWGKTLTTHPLRWAMSALIIFAILIIPLFSIELGPPGENSVPADNPQRISYNIISEKFVPGYNGPLLVVSTLPSDKSTQQNEASLAAIEQAVSTTSGVAAVTPATYNQQNTAAVWSIVPTTSPSDPATETLINTLRDDTIPNATGSSGIDTVIGGQTATFVDMAEQISKKMPIFMAAVIGLAFLLLIVVFRSIFIPVLAAFMIMLTAAATFGVMVAVFQWGWLGGLIGLDGATGPLVSYVPIMVFAIIFGLSMDYMIFLTSRIKEHYLETKDSTGSVIFGLSKSARVIIAAALIMFSVFASFNTESNVVIKMFGTGLAAAIMIDVILARMIVVPAVMTLGKHVTWQFPKSLHWVPNLRFEDSSVFESDKKTTTKSKKSKKSSKAKKTKKRAKK